MSMASYRDIRAIAFVVGMTFSIPATIAQSQSDEEALEKKGKGDS
jgi:hypothetical protein